MATTREHPLLDVRDLRVEFKTRRGTAMVLNGVDFRLHAGETLCVVGESGCGKSMTALALMRLLPENGAVTGGTVSPPIFDTLAILGKASALRRIERCLAALG